MAKVYYNDMLLPDKPNDLPSEYVYAIILGSGDVKLLRVSTSVWYFYSTTDYPSNLKSSASSCYEYKLNGDEWELTNAAGSTYIYADTAENNTIVWSSDNIPNGSENATGVYFYGNAAIPEDSSGNVFLKYRLVIPDFRRGLTSKAPATYANLAEFAVYDSAGTNLALLDGATYKANTYTSDHPTSYAFDGSTTTYWHSDWVTTPNTINWLEVRLPGFVAYDSYKAVSVGLTPQPESSVDFPWMFYILGCNNGSDWRLISSFNPRADGWERGVERIFELPSSEMYTLTRTRLTEFADEVRRLTETTDVLTPAGMLSGLRSVEVGGTSLADNERIYQVGTAASTLDLSGLLFESLCTGHVEFFTYNCAETSSGTSLTTSVDCGAGDLVIAAIVTRDTLTLSDGWTLISTSGVNSSDTTGNGQRLSFAYKYATSESESITVTQASAQRLYINLVALQGATGYTDNGYSYENTATTSITVTKPDGLVLWACSAPLWTTSSPYPIWTVSNDSTVLSLGTSTQSRLAVVLDESSDASVTFTPAAETTMIIGSLTITGMNGFTG